MGFKIGMVYTEIYRKIVRSSFKYFEQCILYISFIVYVN